MSLLRTADLVKRFGRVAAVDGVSLAVRPGEVVGLIGANGAGKTTLIKMALGLLLPTSGEVSLLGESPNREIRRRIGYVPQGLGLYEDLTVGENLSFVAKAFGVDPPKATTADAQRLVGDLPLGAKRRVAFDAAFVHGPELLVLDEPTSGVGLLERTHLWDRIRASAEGGTGVLVTTHHMNEAEECDRVLLMAAGRLIGSGTVDELIGGARVVEVTAGDWAQVFGILDDAGLSTGLRGRHVRVTGAEAAEIEDLLRSAGVTAELSVQPATLEETFVAMTKSAANGA